MKEIGLRILQNFKDNNSGPLVVFCQSLLWQRCDQLNGKEAALPNGKKPCVVVNSQLMLRLGDGLLSRAKDPAPGKGTNRSGYSNGGGGPAPISGDMLGTMSPSSKNAVGGSQLAPSSGML